MSEFLLGQIWGVLSALVGVCIAFEDKWLALILAICSFLLIILR